jgi:hypothetical protein
MEDASLQRIAFGQRKEDKGEENQTREQCVQEEYGYHRILFQRLFLEHIIKSQQRG